MSVEAVLLYKSLTGLTDTDFDNLIVAKVDDLLFKILGLYIESQKVYSLYETIYTTMSLQDLARWLRGEEISINSLIAYVFAKVVEWSQA